MANDSTAPGYLTPTSPPPAPEEDTDLDAVFQSLVAGVTGLPPDLVRPRWQPIPPQQPAADENWCSLGVTSETPNDGPSITHNGAGDGTDTYERHEEIEVFTTFYGPGAQATGKLLRDGLAVPQNTEGLLSFGIRWVECGSLRAVAELVNQQWIRRYDMLLRFRRRVTRTYGVRNIDSSDSFIIDDYGVVTPIKVSGP